jgi:hypothetical protein
LEGKQDYYREFQKAANEEIKSEDASKEANPNTVNMKVR